MLKKIYTTLLAVVLIAGCKKDPGKLVGPTNAYSSANYPTTLGGLQSVLAACYSNLRDPGYLGFWFLPKALSNSMHTVNSLYNGDASWNEMANTNVTPGNQYSSTAWTVFFTGIKNCNVTIAAAALYNAKYAKPGDATTVNYVLGQAYFLRAYYYFQLESLFGQNYVTSAGGGNGLGMPIYSSVPTDLAATQQPRATVAATWAFIEGDLKQAATLLTGANWTGADEGRVTKWSAEGLLGKAYVFNQDWANAKTVLNDVITNSGKKLMTYSQYINAFNGDVANKFNNESLFELNVDSNSMGGYGVYSGAINSSTINGLIWSPVTFGGYNSDGSPFNGTESNVQALGYGNEFFHDQNVLRFGYSLGSNYTLVPNPKYNAAVGPTYFNQKMIIDPVYKQAALQARANQTVDPRLYVNALQPWIDSVKFDGQHYALVAKPINFAGNGNVYGWSFHKYAPVYYNENTGQGNGTSGSVADAWDYYLLRLADVYLLYAEACIGSGDNTTGLEYLNKVKRRAYNYPVDSPSPIDYASLTSKTSAINDPVLGTNPLYYERWAELFNEGSWWYDVCRWRIGKSEAQYFGTAANVNGAFAWDDSKSYVWPIPISELNSNSKIKQNPGY
jgi:hypothetical protein